tara:strand:- start:1165 stop:1413 length:249 start_codon:yes stop_codon:yes gene_type:complete
MNVDRIELNENDSCGDKSKFITIRVTQDELLRLLGITSKCKKLGLNVGVSTIVRKVYNEGLKTLCLDSAFHNPLSLFGGVGE